jgi:hypothetical protein
MVLQIGRASRIAHRAVLQKFLAFAHSWLIMPRFAALLVRALVHHKVVRA